ncbi:MAG: FHA domain-containing protein [Raineya sp.]|jgi:S1-C subfamily serine protease|nr:FHA domain-containing protein [Raineya sp.]
MKTVTIGKSSHNQIIIQDPYVSKEHLQITQDEQGNFFLEDLSSTNGTFVNGKKATSTILQLNDIVKIGDTILPWQSYFTEKQAYNDVQTGELLKKISLGRASNNDFVISNTTVSSHHAYLEIYKNGLLKIIDNQSSNGTFINSKKINFAFITNKDSIALGDYTLSLNQVLSTLVSQPSSTKQITEKAPQKNLIFGIIFVSLVILGLGILATFYLLSNDYKIPENSQKKQDTLQKDSLKKDNKGLSDLIEQAENSVFLVTPYARGAAQGYGSGFFVTDTGIGVSNHHVFNSGNSWSIKLKNGKTHKVTKILKQDSKLDYVIFETDAKNVKGLPIATEIPRKGHDVFVIGNPQGLELSVTKGIISGIRNYDTVIGQVSDGDDYLQMDAPISSGNSGGPVFNMQGEVVGISTMVITPIGGVSQNLNLAINIQKLNIPKE